MTRVVMSFLIASHKVILWVSFLPIVENFEHHVASDVDDQVCLAHIEKGELGELVDHGVCSPRIALPWKDCLGIRQLHPEGAELFTSSIASGSCSVSYLIKLSGNCHRYKLKYGKSCQRRRFMANLSLEVYGLKRPLCANQGIKT